MKIQKLRFISAVITVTVLGGIPAESCVLPLFYFSFAVRGGI
jgi:hypothetical protein